MIKLKENILSVKYSSTNTAIKKPIHLSNDCKEVIENIIDNKFKKILYKKLNHNDKVTIDQFVKTMKFGGVDASEGLNEKQSQYEILCGEWNSGNDSTLIKKIKQYVLKAMAEGIINKSQGHQIIFQLNI